jgi:hypothetical protein
MWPRGALSRAEGIALSDIQHLISTGALRCARTRRDPDSDSVAAMLDAWSSIDHAAACPSTTTCHRVAVLGNAARMLEAARLATAACRDPMPVCQVWPLMRRHVEERLRGYLDAVVAGLAAGVPETESPYADICWDRSTDDEFTWEIRPDQLEVSTSINEVGGGLTVTGMVTVGDAWQACWSAGTGWSFGYLWAGRLWDPQWPGVQPFGQYGDRVPAAALLAAEFATFLDTDPLSAPAVPDDGYEDWAMGDVFTDEQAAGLATRLGTAAGLPAMPPQRKLLPVPGCRSSG